MKNKTLAAWLAFLGGPLGLHRFYLKGWGDWLGWALWVPTLLGLWGLERVQALGLDDTLSWVLLPVLGFNIAACALCAIVYGLMTPEKWNRRYNPGLAEDAAPGRTHWGTIAVLAAALLIGTGVLMTSLVYSFQRYFEYQIDEARKISQPAD
ncbi:MULTISPECIES: NINE protein [Curvibacter]|jgi:hypothetical protein|uniref:NINE protein n=1 Tax=Curvibacter TaxID=281915 RepID=UPI000375F4B8|nr:MULTISPECIES: NINE protein [Curvibacter]MBV5292057.1 NINE protein [Curvibacter lanceolatus]